MRHGLLIYDKGFYNEARKKFDEVVKKWELKRIEVGWISLKIARKYLGNSRI